MIPRRPTASHKDSLSLFKVTVGMALVLLVGTLNQFMMVELSVAVMLALPLLFAPLSSLIGFRSDTHVSALGPRRVPFIWRGMECRKPHRRPMWPMWRQLQPDTIDRQALQHPVPGRCASKGADMTDEMIDTLWARVNSADRNKVVAYADALPSKPV